MKHFISLFGLLLTFVTICHCLPASVEVIAQVPSTNGSHNRTDRSLLDVPVLPAGPEGQLADVTKDEKYKQIENDEIGKDAVVTDVTTNESNYTGSTIETTITPMDNNTKRYVITTMDWMATEPPYVAMLWVIYACIVKMAIEWNPILIRYAPESCFVVIAGFIVGLVTWFSRIDTYLMDSEAFFIYLLPPVIIEAGYFMPKRIFFDNIGTVLWFAVIATLWATFTIGFSLYGFSESGGINAIKIHLNMVHCLTYAGLIAAVDPVAVLATFEEIHVNEVLHIIVFGESLLNDGVTVVMFNLLNGFSVIGQENIIGLDIAAGTGSFFLVGLGGTAIGVIVGFVGAFVVRFAENLPLVEPLLVISFAYLTYLTPEIFNLSAILGAVFGNITLYKYVEPNLSKKSHTVVKYFFKMVAAICETIIFLFLGCYIVNYNNAWETGFVLLNLFFCLAYRSAGVLVLTFICNWFRNNHLNMIDQFIMAYGGIRGGIAFALATEMDPNVYPQKALFMTATAICVYYTIFVLGITIKPLVVFMKVKKSDKHKPSMGEKISIRVCDHLMAGIDFIAGTHGHNDARLRFQDADRRVFKHIVLRTKNRVKPKGTSIITVYEKLLEKDAREYIEREKSFVSNAIAASESMSQLWRSQTPPDTGLLPYDSKTVPIAHGTSVLDMRILEPGDPNRVYNDAELHHVLSEVMFQKPGIYQGPAPYERYTYEEEEETEILRRKAHMHMHAMMKKQHRRSRSRSRSGSRASSHLAVGSAEKKSSQDRNSKVTVEPDRQSLHSEGGIVFSVSSPQDDRSTPYLVDIEVEPSPRARSPVGDPYYSQPLHKEPPSSNERFYNQDVTSEVILDSEVSTSPTDFDRDLETSYM